MLDPKKTTESSRAVTVTGHFYLTTHKFKHANLVPLACSELTLLSRVARTGCIILVLASFAVSAIKLRFCNVFILFS